MRLIRELQTLATFSETPAPSVTRVVYSEQDMRARAWLKGLLKEAGLQVREDAVGNTFARWIGSAPELAAVGTGSHIDAIPNAGMYDGTVGVLGGLEAIRSLQARGFRPRRSIELLMFTSEEPTRYGIGCLGSRLLAGVMDPGSLRSIRLPADYYEAFVELHIEQGPLLEQRGVPIGAVTAIAAPASLRIEIEGNGGHAGAVLMPGRHDAFLAAAEIALALEAAAKTTGAVDSVATTGICDIFPRAINSIPSRVEMTADIRDIDVTRRDSMIAALEGACRRVAAERAVSVSKEFINLDEPATCDPRIVALIEQAAEKHGLACERMVSRAYHDSLFMSRICPTAMIFIPCRDGISHRPDEYASPEAIAAGVLVLTETLAQAAG